MDATSTCGPRRPIHFLHRGQRQCITDAAPTRSLLDWLREDQRCTGTKEGCNEGDCGACTVLVAERDDTAPGGVRLRNVNACLSFLPTLDGKAVLTVEDLAPLAQTQVTTQTPPQENPAPHLHPVQQALVDCHGSQCGFCTPGFAMTLTAVYEQAQHSGCRPQRQQLADALAGNLCRCTGYRPILDAGAQMFEHPPVTVDRAALRQALDGLAQDPPLHYTPASLQRSDTAADNSFHAPQTLEALAALCAAKPQARLLAGATDIALWVNKQMRPLGELIYTGRVAELRTVTPISTDSGPALRIGAAVPLEDAWQALATHFPALREVWQRFASPPVRHSGTLGGNIANGSPIGDGPPVLIALGATVVLRHGAQERQVPLDGFYLDYMKNARQPGECLTHLIVPLPSRPAPEAAPATQHLRVWKVSKRYDSDISAVCGAFVLHLSGPDSQDHDTPTSSVPRVLDVRLVYGGLAATVKRAAHAEVALRGQPWTAATVQAAQQALAQDFQPLTDMRASAAYRRQIAANLLQRLWLETRAEAPLRPDQTTVWHERLTSELTTATPTSALTHSLHTQPSQESST